VALAATAPILILLTFALPLPFSYKLYLDVLWMALSVAVNSAISGKDLRRLKGTQAQREAAFKDFVRMHTAAQP
jgi:hypothetical protein